MCTSLTKGNYSILTCCSHKTNSILYPTALEQHRSFYKGFACSVAQQGYPREAILGRWSKYELKSKARLVGVAQRGDIGNLFLYYLRACVGESVKCRCNYDY